MSFTINSEQLLRFDYKFYEKIDFHKFQLNLVRDCDRIQESIKHMMIVIETIQFDDNQITLPLSSKYKPSQLAASPKQNIRQVKHIILPRRVSRNSQWRGCFGGLGRRPMGVRGRSPQQAKAGDLGARLPAGGGTGVWGRSPQRSKILHFFAKITSF